MPKTTVHTILQEIGIRALREYIYKYLPAPDFHSHDFTRNFEHHFTTQYIQMQGLYAHKSTIEERNGTKQYLLKSENSLIGIVICYKLRKAPSAYLSI